MIRAIVAVANDRMGHLKASILYRVPKVILRRKMAQQRTSGTYTKCTDMFTLATSWYVHQERNECGQITKCVLTKRTILQKKKKKPLGLLLQKIEVAAPCKRGRGELNVVAVFVDCSQFFRIYISFVYAAFIVEKYHTFGLAEVWRRWEIVRVFI